MFGQGKVGEFWHLSFCGHEPLHVSVQEGCHVSSLYYCMYANFSIAFVCFSQNILLVLNIIYLKLHLGTYCNSKNVIWTFSKNPSCCNNISEKEDIQFKKCFFIVSVVPIYMYMYTLEKFAIPITSVYFSNMPVPTVRIYMIIVFVVIRWMVPRALCPGWSWPSWRTTN